MRHALSKTQSEIASIAFGCRMVKDKMYKTLSYTLLGDSKNILLCCMHICVAQIKKINVDIYSYLLLCNYICIMCDVKVIKAL